MKRSWCAVAVSYCSLAAMSRADRYGRARTPAIRSRDFPASVVVRAGRGVPVSDLFETTSRAICGNSQPRPVCCYRVWTCNMTCNAETRRKPPLLQRYRCYRSLIGSGGMMG
jgi:hypothetical protein